MVDLSTSSVDLGEVGSDNEEVPPTTTDNLPSNGDVKVKVVLLKARVKFGKVRTDHFWGMHVKPLLKGFQRQLMWVCCHPAIFITFGVFPYCAFGKVMSLTAAACTSHFGGTCHCCSVPVHVTSAGIAANPSRLRSSSLKRRAAMWLHAWPNPALL